MFRNWILEIGFVFKTTGEARFEMLNNCKPMFLDGDVDIVGIEHCMFLYGNDIKCEFK